jgi:hypothetical protein
MTASGLLRSAVVALASVRPGPGVRGRGVAALRGAWLRGLLAAMLERQPLGTLLESLGEAGPGGAPAEDGRAVLEALRRWPTTCLYRALAGYAVMRARGEDARFVIGIRPGSGELLAHAWLERDGQAIGEPDDPRQRYAVAFVHPSDAAPRPPARTNLENHMDQLRPSPDALLTELKDGTGVLLHLRTKFYYALNRTGVAAWKLIEAGRAASVDAVAAELAAAFSGTTLEEVRRDVAALVRELGEEGLILPPRSPPRSGG